MKNPKEYCPCCGKFKKDHAPSVWKLHKDKKFHRKLRGATNDDLLKSLDKIRFGGK